MLTEAEKQIIQSTWRLVVPIADTAADLFYKRLFELQPSYRAFFKIDMAAQKKKLVAMLAFIVQSLDWPESAWREEVAEEDDLFLVVLALGRRHSELYNIPDSSYETVGEALLWTLDYGLGKAFDEGARAAWGKIYGLLSTTMKMGRLSVQPRAESDRKVAGVVTPNSPRVQPS